MAGCLLALSVSLGAALGSPAMERVHDRPFDPIVARSLIDTGDTARLKRAVLRALRGDRVVIGAIGGSITAGASASVPEARWPNRVAEWWRRTFPRATVELVNAGIGATGSDFGSHRIGRDLLRHRPDVVVVEYGVNDGGSTIAGETLEGLVRQILRQPNAPAALLLFTMNEAGDNMQAAHVPVGRHYGLPMVSMRDALWPEISAGRLLWTDVEADAVHPNDRGHAECARFITEVFERALASIQQKRPLPRVRPLPRPLISDVFEHTSLSHAGSLLPLSCTGWSVAVEPPMGIGPFWRADRPGSEIEFEVEGSAISLMFYRVKGAMGIAEAQVDGRPPVRMDAWFDADWGGYTPFQLVARDLPPGRKRLRVRLLPDRNPGSSGSEFRLHAVLQAGLPNR